MRVGPYELVEELGFGGMGQVHLGRRRGPAGFEKWVAVKTLHPHLAKQDEFVGMFLDEARIAARMSHPNVAQVFELGESEGRFFLAMEYLEGVDLAELWKACDGPMEPRMASAIVARAARGLHYAHEAAEGLVHRDVSPKNVILTFHGDVKVTDFGIASVTERAGERTATGHVKGKCAYLSPEQAASEKIDRRTDIFALGIVFWELLRGERLFKAPTDAETIARIIDHRVPPLDEIDEALRTLVERALAAEPDDRWATAEEMAEALEAWGGAKTSELATFVRELVPERKKAAERLMTRAAAMVAETQPEKRIPDESPELSNESPHASTDLLTAKPSGGSKRSWWLGGAALVAVALAIFFGMSRGGDGARLRVVTTPAGAWVEVDGERRGTTPTEIELAQGRHHVRIGHEGYLETDEHVALEGSETLRATLVEQPEEASVDEVAGADPPEVVSQGSEESGESRELGQSSEVSDTVVATGPRAETSPRPARRRRTASTQRSEPAEAPPSESAHEAPPERAEPAVLNLLSRPWATLRINGRDAGRTPLLARPIEPGVTEIELRAEGEGEPVLRRFTATPGETINLRVDLN